MLKLEDLKAWLVAGGVAGGQAANVSTGEQPEKGDLNLTLRDTSGLGLTLEGAFDRPTFQALSRGPTGAAARDLAYEVDGLILDSEKPFDLGDYRVIDAGRVGGNPGYLGIDDRRRTEYGANYWMEISR
jgi:hypothetical protein